MDILDILANDNYITLNKTLAKEIGLEPAILFGALSSYQRYYKDEEFYKEQDKIMEDTCLSEYLIRTATKKLVELNLVSVTKKGLPAKNYYKLNTTTVCKFLRTSGIKNDTTGDIKSDTTLNKNIEIKNNINNNTSSRCVTQRKEPKHKYGEYQNVLLTDNELERLNNEYGNEQTKQAIKYLDEYIEMKGYKAKSHNLAIRKWVFDALKEKELKNSKKSQGRQYTKTELNNLFADPTKVEL